MRKYVFPVLVLVTGALVLSTLLVVFFATPSEAKMGIVQKIFYFHVPAAYAMYLGWTVCAVASVVYVVGRNDKWDMMAHTGAELAMLFACIVMITGPLWGKKAWGAYWTWDPRLTSSLLLTVIVASYMMLRNLGRSEVTKRFCAALAIMGALVLPIIHVSVNKWRGQHPSVLGSSGGGLADEMMLPFVMGLISFTFLFAVIAWQRYALEKTRRILESLKQNALESGVVEDSNQ